eukprot:6039-Heterococcus_DN1.PRE.2
MPASSIWNWALLFLSTSLLFSSSRLTCDTVAESGLRMHTQPASPTALCVLHYYTNSDHTDRTTKSLTDATCGASQALTHVRAVAEAPALVLLSQQTTANAADVAQFTRSGYRH